MLTTPLLLLPLAAPAGAQTEAGFDAAFTGAVGNDWWLQVDVRANEPVARVEASIDNGAWRLLQLQSWGSWAASYHAPDGSVVRFRATSTGNATDLSGCYQWTLATSIACPGEAPPADVEENATTSVSFRHGGGNEWWVEVDVQPKPASVEARDTGGAWKPLTLRSWGEWAGSFHIEPGHEVQFRATSGSGNVSESCWFSHPAGVERCRGGETPPEDSAPPEETAPPVVNGSRRLVVLGDTGVGANARANVNGSLADNVTGLIGTGDYYYWDPPSRWLEVFAPLLRMNETHLARGNHDDPAAMPSVFPTGTTWSAEVAGARLAGVDSTKNMAPGSAQHAAVREALCTAEEELRVLVVHHTWWLGADARHPGTEFPASAADMDRLVAECGVDLVLAGHEHNYQRMMRGDVAYVIMGAGGQSLYPVHAPPGTVASAAVYGRVLLDLNASGYQARFRTLEGDTLDTFGGSSNTTYVGAPPPEEPAAVAFAHGGGNEWWVEASVTPRPTAVEAMDTGGTWVPLTLRSWGEWAGSFHLEPGHQVRFRASTNGTWQESCWFSHPSGGACAGAAPAPPADGFDATFGRVSGNEWWVQVGVTGNEPITGVDARVNGGGWRALELKSWGDWAASLHAPAGSIVEFRARSTSGATDVSGTYRWPPA